MRYSDWKVRLMQYLAEAARRPLVPGQHDCALFSAGAVEAMTGVDLAAPWRGTYSSFEEGFNALRAAGFESHVDLAAANFEEIKVAFAAPGDLVAMATNSGDVLGVVQGEGFYVLTARGLGVWPMTDAHRAFRVA